MSIESSLNETRIPSTPIPYVVSGIPLTPLAMMVVVLEVPILTSTQRVVCNRPIQTNPFGSLFGKPRYRSWSIPSVSNPFSFGMPNMMSQLSSSIPKTNAIPSFGHGGMTPLHAHVLFDGSHIPQTNHTVGVQPTFSFESNPSLNATGWSTQLGGQATSYILSFPPSSTMSISTNTFVMKNPPLSLEFHPEGVSFTLWETPSLELL
jgi:hypothetical protein